ncbi:hypothetical protein F2P56_004827 [Juglans regia]|uniref:Uncharacterized protein LOC109014472 n=2 Tax=Juglans regia TaxID=51240 RepID=A0A2I4H8M7_JUGRE|nr:uncharacterized protein LOC109014472 [Juglans regia]XP_018852496.1 uncharacterized protein LOC109014472 [Juglans regia]KAF5478251.1 hypothetical protein F2P56_004827 [Juglans regia]
MMPPSSNIGDALKFQQRWEVRRDNELDSSSEESKSSSSGQPVLKKHKLVSSFTSHENDESTDTSRFQLKGKNVAGTGAQIKNGKSEKTHSGRNRKENLVNDAMRRDSHEELKRKKNETSVSDLDALGDVKIFMESLLEDLKDTRENLFRWMREEMQKLVADDTVSKPKRKKGSYGRENIQGQHVNNLENNRIQLQNKFEDNIQVHHNFEETLQVQHQNNFKKSIEVQRQNNFKEKTQAHSNNFKENIQVQHQNNDEKNYMQSKKDLKSGMRVQNCNHGSAERSGDINEAAGYVNHYQSSEDRANCRKTIGPMAPRVKENGETRLVSSVMPKFQSGPSVQVQHQKNVVLGLRAPNCNDGSSERSVKGRQVADSNNCSKALEDQVGYVQASGFLPSTEKAKGERLGLPDNQKFPSDSSDKVASSMYLTLPAILREPCADNYRLDTSSCDYVNPVTAGNWRALNSENANLMIDSSTYRDYFPDMQQEERLGSFAQTGSSIIECLNQNSTPTSSMGTGFPVPLVQGMDGGFNTPSQLGLRSVPQENYDLLGLRMDGGAIRFSGGNYALSEQYVANNFNGHSSYTADGGLMGFQTPGLKGGRLFSK